MRVEILSDRPVTPNLVAGNAGVACAFPQSALLANGDVACFYRQGTTKHSHDGILMLQTSADMGLSWSEPRLVYDGLAGAPPQTAVSGGICQTKEGTLFAIFSTVEGLLPGVYMFSEEGNRCPRHVFALRSRDYGRTWSAPQKVRLNTFPSYGITTKPFVLPTGELFIPIEVQTLAGAQSTFITFSRDDGRTFDPLVTCADDPTGTFSLCDARFTFLPDGRLLTLLWTFVVKTEETIEVRSAFSSDAGRTWTPPQSTGILGQITMPLALSSGLVIAASNYRWPPDGIRLWHSLDGGTTWDARSAIQMWDVQASQVLGESVDVRPATAPAEDVWQALGRFTFGTPDLVALPDGSILLTYYATIQQIIHVRACRFLVWE